MSELTIRRAYQDDTMNSPGLRYDQYGDGHVMRLANLQRPKIADDEVLIRVQSASINPFDWKLRSGLLRKFLDIELPITPGRDGCGEIVALGRGVNKSNGGTLSTNQRVSFISSRITQGAHAQFVAVRAADFVVPAPDNLTPQECAALPLVALSAWNALIETAGLKPGMKVLVHGGSGGVGAAAIQIGKHFGAEVFATCRSANVEVVRKLGAEAIPYDRLDFAKAVSDCDIVFDTVGGKVHEQSYSVLKPGGFLTYLLATPFDDHSADYDVTTQQAVVLNRTDNLKSVMALASDGILKPVISHSLPLTEFHKAFQIAEAGGAGGKIILTIKD